MAKLPEPTSPVVNAIYAWREAKLEKPRPYLGGSLIGRECERELWYRFRWVRMGQTFDGRMLRLFDRGQREEAVFVEELRGIGVTVHDTDPSTGQQFRFKAVAGHAAGGIDGAALGVPEAPKTWHLLEFKTHNARSFADLLKNGVANSKPEHWAQMQIYMRWAQLERALYLAVNKDTDELYAERVRFDAKAAERLEARAERVIYAAEPLPKLSEDPAFWKCKGCTFARQCHGGAFAEVSCRTCLHATPERDGDGRWSCALHKRDLGWADQQAGCDEHRFIPALVPAEVVDASEAENWVEYRAGDFQFRNGPRTETSYGSRELAALGLTALQDPELVKIRAGYLPAAQWVAGSERPEAA